MPVTTDRTAATIDADLFADEDRTYDPFDVDPTAGTAADDTAAKEDEDDSLFLPPRQHEENGPAGAQHESGLDPRSPYERTRDLIEEMAPFRSTLVGILTFCLEARDARDVFAEVERLKQTSFSVYSPAALCAQLEDAGALERSDGGDQTEPRVVLENGVEYLEPAEERVVLWTTTDAGKKAVDEFRPADELRALFDEDARYAAIYLQLLDMCAAGDGSTAKQMDEAVGSDPLLAEPRLFAAYFFGNLADRCALEWTGSAWKTTQAGLDAIDILQAEYL